MIVLGLQMLGLLPRFGASWCRNPSLTACMTCLPEGGGRRIHTRRADFFLPCGFTQALQLYVLGKGSFATGAVTMLVFALGTLPALLSLSALSSFAKGDFQKAFPAVGRRGGDRARRAQYPVRAGLERASSGRRPLRRARHRGAGARHQMAASRSSRCGSWISRTSRPSSR